MRSPPRKEVLVIQGVDCSEGVLPQAPDDPVPRLHHRRWHGMAVSSPAFDRTTGDVFRRVGTIAVSRRHQRHDWQRKQQNKDFSILVDWHESWPGYMVGSGFHALAAERFGT